MTQTADSRAISVHCRKPGTLGAILAWMTRASPVTRYSCRLEAHHGVELADDTAADDAAADTAVTQCRLDTDDGARPAHDASQVLVVKVTERFLREHELLGLAHEFLPCLGTVDRRHFQCRFTGAELSKQARSVMGFHS